MTDQQKNDLYTEYRPKVFGYILNKINDRNTAEDLTSDVFLKVYEKIDTFDENKSSVSTWIFTIMRNRLIDYYRTRRVFEEIPEEYEAPGDVDDDICDEETLEELAKALKKLGERERDIIIMKYYSGKTLKEIADILGISYAYVKVLHAKALDALKEMIG